MLPSQTPPNEPHQCPRCRRRLTLTAQEADVRCPHCGCLLWFTRMGGSTPQERAIPHGEAEKTKEAIRALVRQLAALSKREIPPAEYFEQFLEKVVRALAARCGVVWLRQARDLTLLQQFGLSESGISEQMIAHSRHQQLLKELLDRAEPALVQPDSADATSAAPSNPTDSLLARIIRNF